MAVDTPYRARHGYLFCHIQVKISAQSLSTLQWVSRCSRPVSLPNPTIRGLNWAILGSALFLIRGGIDSYLATNDHDLRSPIVISAHRPASGELREEAREKINASGRVVILGSRGRHAHYNRGTGKQTASAGPQAIWQRVSVVLKTAL